MTTVVLGWDGLDHTLATEWNVADQFSRHNKRIETFENPVLEKPHTKELWPAIITGERPDVTDIHAATDDAGTQWDDDRIDRLSSVAGGVVPERVREPIGRWLRNRGAELRAATPDHYADRGVDTVFDDRDALPLALPNYRVESDHELGLLTDRGAQLQSYLTIETHGDETTHSPDVPLKTFEQGIASHARKKLGVVETALQRDYDIVFVWLAYLDTVGHLAPTVGDEDWQRRQYEQAARWTSDLRSSLAPSDTLIVASDHGLRDGEHTHDAFFGADDRHIVDGVSSVTDIAAEIEAVTPRSSESGIETDATRAASVRENLQELGYI